MHTETAQVPTQLSEVVFLCSAKISAYIIFYLENAKYLQINNRKTEIWIMS